MNKPNTQVAQSRATDPQQSLAKLLNDALPELKRIAPKYISLSRLTSLAIEATQRNQLLAKCSPMSVLNFCKKCSEWGTDRVGAGGVWPVPFWNKNAGCYDMTPIPDWRLLIEKCKKAKAITDAYADAVHEKDHFDYERGTSPALSHKPARGNRGKLTEVYCVYALPDGSKNFVVMDFETEIVPIRNRSKAWQAWIDKKYSCPWVTDEDEMSKKTVVKRTMKLFEGASPELTAMIASDNTVHGVSDLEILPPMDPIQMPRALDIQSSASESPQADAPQEAGDAAGGQSAPSEPERRSPAPSAAQDDALRPISRSEVKFESFERVDSPKGTPKPWTAWFCKFSTDSGAELEAGTSSASLAETLDVLVGQNVEITTRPGKKTGSTELVTISPIAT
jgi:recombination protein RecT